MLLYCFREHERIAEKIRKFLDLCDIPNTLSPAGDNIDESQAFLDESSGSSDDSFEQIQKEELVGMQGSKITGEMEHQVQETENIIQEGKSD